MSTTDHRGPLPSAKRHSRITEARLLIARAQRHCKLNPYQSPARGLIADMRLALEGLLSEIEGK